MRDAMEMSLESWDKEWVQGKRKGFFKDEVVDISEDKETKKKSSTAGWAAASSSKGEEGTVMEARVAKSAMAAMASRAASTSAAATSSCPLDTGSHVDATGQWKPAPSRSDVPNQSTAATIWPQTKGNWSGANDAKQQSSSEANA